MKCPHCGVAFHDKPALVNVGGDIDGAWHLVVRDCPECRRKIFALQVQQQGSLARIFLCHPKAPNRPVAPEVPKDFAQDFSEASLTLADSPKASAALSRRCLQHTLRDVLKVKHGDLASEIQQVLDAKSLPTPILEALDGVRNIGNFAAHPIKSTASGEVIDVEPGEAEWNLDVLEALFDYVFVQPAVLQRKKDALNAKLAAAGKPALRQP